MTAGWSLIELLVAVSIMAIIAAFSVPSIQTLYQRSEERVLQQTIIDALAFAKQEARILNEPVVVRPRSDDWLRGIEALTVSHHPKILSQWPVPKVSGRLIWRGYPSYHPYPQLDPDEHYTANGSFLYYRDTSQTVTWTITLNKQSIATLT